MCEVVVRIYDVANMFDCRVELNEDDHATDAERDGSKAIYDAVNQLLRYVKMGKRPGHE